jgi:hypothetical protein
MGKKRHHAFLIRRSRTRSGDFAGLKLHKAAPFVGCVGFSTKSKTPHTPDNRVGGEPASEQAVAYVRENTEDKHKGRIIFHGSSCIFRGVGHRRTAEYCYHSAATRKTVDWMAALHT